jgi:hypothetical protein
VPDDEDKPVPPPRQPIAWGVSAKLDGAKFKLSAHARKRRLVWQLEPDNLGRPSSRDLVRAEAQRQLDSAEPVPPTLKEFGNKLSKWLRDNHPDAPPMAGPTVEDNIRDLFSAR